jgi:hypothetical protein
MPANLSGKPLLAMIALNKAALPDMACVVEGLEKRHPEEPAPQEATRGLESAVFRWGAGPVAVALKPAPIPLEELEDACQAAWYWEGAGESLARHTAHLIVSLAPTGEDALGRHLRLTRVVAAILPQCDAAGVYWPGGSVVHEPKAFLEQAADLSRENLYPALWVQMRIVPNDDDTWCFYTTGMPPLGRLEIEIPSTLLDPSTLYELCAGIIHYLIVSDEQIADGGTIERAESEQIAVRYGPSMFDESQQVMRLEF